MSTLIHRIVAHLLAGYAELLTKTCRVEIQGWEYIASILSGDTPIIFTTWHGQVHMLYPAFKDRVDFHRLAMVVVDDQRQDILTPFGHVAGVQTYPMIRSDTSMGGASRMVALLKALRGGKFTYMAPDGPDGPPRVAKEGVVFLASRLNAWLVPLGAACRRAFHLKRWDRYALPLPFSLIRVVVGQPLRASRQVDRDSLLKELSQQLDATLEAAGSH